MQTSFGKTCNIYLDVFWSSTHVCVWSCIAGRQLLSLSSFSAVDTSWHPVSLCWKWFPDPSSKTTWRFCSCKLIANCKYTERNSNAVPEQPITSLSVTTLVPSPSHVLSSWLDFLTWMGVRWVKISFPGYWIVVDFNFHILTVLSTSLCSWEVYENGVRQGCLAPLSLGMV